MDVKCDCDCECIILVEGKDDEIFLHKYFEHLQKTNYQIFSPKTKDEKNASGKEGLKKFIKPFCKTNIPKGRIKKIAIIADADSNIEQEYKDYLKEFEELKKDDMKELVLPNEKNKMATKSKEDEVAIGIYLMPGEGETGMLETLCYNIAKECEPIICKEVEEYMKKIEQIRGNEKPKNRDKAILQIYLSSKAEHTTSVGQGARYGYWNFNSKAMETIKEFVESIFL